MPNTAPSELDTLSPKQRRCLELARDSHGIQCGAHGMREATITSCVRRTWLATYGDLFVITSNGLDALERRKLP